MSSVLGRLRQLLLVRAAGFELLRASEGRACDGHRLAGRAREGSRQQVWAKRRAAVFHAADNYTVELIIQVFSNSI